MAVSAVLSPYHLINNAGIALNYLYDLIAYILIGIIRHGSSEVAVFIHLDGNIDCLKQPRSRRFPQRIKQALSSASGRSVDVRMQTAGKGCPTLVKKLLSSGSVPESETTAKAFICRQL